MWASEGIGAKRQTTHENTNPKRNKHFPINKKGKREKRKKRKKKKQKNRRKTTT